MAQTVHHLLNPAALKAGTAKLIQRWLTQAEHQLRRKRILLLVSRRLVLVSIQHQQRTSTMNIIMLIMDGTSRSTATVCTFMKAGPTWVASVLIQPARFLMLFMMVQM